MAENMKSLLKNNEVFCWCNETGDLRLPDNPNLQRMENMPHEIQRLIKNHWTDQYRVETIQGISGISLVMIFDDWFVQDIIEKIMYRGNKLDEYRNKVFELTIRSLEEKAGNGVRVFFNKKVSDYEDEIIVFVPEAVMDKMDTNELKHGSVLDSDMTYALYEREMKKAMEYESCPEQDI